MQRLIPQPCRVVHLTRLPALNSNGSSQARHSDPTIFADLQTRLKECVSATFDAVVEMQGDVVKREGSKRNVPGWNFCKWMAGMVSAIWKVLLGRMPTHTPLGMRGKYLRGARLVVRCSGTV